MKEKYDDYLNSKISTSKQPDMNFFATISFSGGITMYKTS
jgi:hypothetical protein